MKLWMLISLILTVNLVSPSDPEGLPAYYQPVIGAYETFHQQFQEPLTDEGEESYVDAREIDRLRTGDLRYTLYDLDENETMELLIADQEVFRIFTFKDREVVSLAGFTPEEPLVDQVQLEIYPGGKVLMAQDFNQKMDQIALYQINDQGDGLEVVFGLTYDASQSDPSGQDLVTGETLSLKGFQDQVIQEAGEALDLEDLDWQPLVIQDPQAEWQQDLDAWTMDQQQALDNAFKEWAADHHQDFEALTPANNVPFYGPGVPQEHFDILVEDQPVRVNYRGPVKEGEWRILAAYTDLRDPRKSPSKRQLYLFVEDSNQARVLVTSQGPNEEGLLNFQEAEDQDLQEIFKQIYQQDTAIQ